MQTAAPTLAEPPLLGILFTGPIGFFAGLARAVWCEVRRGLPPNPRLTVTPQEARAGRGM